MSQQAKALSMTESCEVFQRRNRRIFGERILAEQQEPPKVASRSFEKDSEDPSPFKNSNSLSNHSPPVNERQTKQSRSRRMAHVTRFQPIEHTVVMCHRTSQRQGSQFPSIEGKQRKPQQAKVVPAKQRKPRQAKMVSAKLSVARQNDTEENTECSEGRAAFKGDAMTNRPCSAHTSLAVPWTRTTIPQTKTKERHLEPEAELARNEPSKSKQSTEKHRGAIKHKQKAEARPSLAVPGTIPKKIMLKKGTSGIDFKQPSASEKQNPRKNKQIIESATKQQQKQRVIDDRIKLTGGIRVADMNQLIQKRRQETRVQCTGRRVGLCVERDHDQQQLTFLRVLRKRF